ncbi:MAG: glycosyltransferase family 39 protein [Planctomycetes bacterium]|nr:glycosyltransferase family 39 protein [Planctomycetota bacterium]
MSLKTVSLTFVLTLALITGFAFEGTRGLYESSEGRYAECAREMVETGNYVEPQVGYRPHLTKPPLTYWAIAGGLELLRDNEWGARLYNAIAFVLTVFVATAIGSILWDKTCGLIAGLIYASSPFPVIGAYFVTTDTLLTLWVATAVLCYLKACKEMPGNLQRIWIWGMWLFFGIAVLTKGSAGLVFLFPVLVWHILQKKPAKIILSPIGILLFLAVGFSWYITLCLRRSGTFAFLLNEQFTGRFTGNLRGHEAPNSEWYKAFLMYLPALTVGAGPWLYFLVRDLRMSRILDILKFRHYRDANRIENLLLLLLMPAVLFFIAKSKLIFYVLPFYTVISLVTARRIRQSNYKISPIVRMALISGLILIAVKGVLAYLPIRSDMKPVCAICREVQTPATRFVAFDEPKLFGLQFYLHGNLKHVFSPGKDDEHNGDESLEEMIRDIQQSHGPQSWAIIANQKHFQILESRLKEAGLPYKTRATKYWILCLTGPA